VESDDAIVQAHVMKSYKDSSCSILRLHYACLVNAYEVRVVIKCDDKNLFFCLVTTFFNDVTR